ncbi:MAG: hypothetical protein E6K79_01365 [Candidatus Eisenbacteria bacterium]|uniref:Uncharacterized protein n=1 Tax=Eiseniibacteriota bacterium TaxID=2212470 RepID=A0A538TSJ7_UNCEI|nr:MAG: hypothetical protein E6K79_01365 [Candidatus Eisenbacteria bacterium]
MRRPRFDWWGITLYAAAMAFVETACVVSLKRLYFPEGWRPPFHAIPADGLLLEQARETATLVMIAAVAFLGRPAWREGAARFLWIFGIWDLLYYAFLRFLTGFPSGLGDRDIVFLVPHEWIFPVWVPFACSIGSLVVALLLHRSGTREG